MRRLLVIAALTASTAACASASAPSTEPAPADVAVIPVESTTAPEAVDASTAGASDQVVRMISLPAPSGDPELDALGAEIAGLEEQLAALDAAAADFGGTP